MRVRISVWNSRIFPHWYVRKPIKYRVNRKSVDQTCFSSDSNKTVREKPEMFGFGSCWCFCTTNMTTNTTTNKLLTKRWFGFSPALAHTGPCPILWLTHYVYCSEVFFIRRSNGSEIGSCQSKGDLFSRQQLNSLHYVKSGLKWSGSTVGWYLSGLQFLWCLWSAMCCKSSAAWFDLNNYDDANVSFVLYWLWGWLGSLFGI